MELFVKHDPEAEAVYITLGNKGLILRTEELDDRVLVDVDENGDVLGVEILGVTKVVTQ